MAQKELQLESCLLGSDSKSSAVVPHQQMQPEVALPVAHAMVDREWARRQQEKKGAPSDAMTLRSAREKDE